MSKNKKKRNKAYTGADAAIVKPIITRIEAVNRNKISQWWFENQKAAKPILTTSGIIIAVIIFIIQIIRIASGS